jgi:hypothetical protein
MGSMMGNFDMRPAPEVVQKQNSEAMVAASIQLPPDSDDEESNSGNDDQASRLPNETAVCLMKPPSSHAKNISYAII